jgi:galactose oxidase
VTVPRKSISFLLGCLLASSALGQVRSVTLGITTHCPYGVGGCWAEIRNGLNLPEAIEALPQRPDTKTQTCSLYMREGWLPDPGLFARNFTNMNVGVDVRGVEAMVDGRVEMEGTNLVLRVKGSKAVLRLAPLERKVQWDLKRKRPEAATRSERKAFEKLVRVCRKEPGQARVTGPLKASKPGDSLIMEVRKFELSP